MAARLNLARLPFGLQLLLLSQLLLVTSLPHEFVYSLLPTEPNPTGPKMRYWIAGPNWPQGHLRQLFSPPPSLQQTVPTASLVFNVSNHFRLYPRIVFESISVATVRRKITKDHQTSGDNASEPKEHPAVESHKVW